MAVGHGKQCVKLRFNPSHPTHLRSDDHLCQQPPLTIPTFYSPLPSMASFRSDKAKKPYTVRNSSRSIAQQTSNNFPSIFQRPEPRDGASDGMWLHDKAPGMPRAMKNSIGGSKTDTGLNSKLIVSNLHYEVTSKDLTVSPKHPNHPKSHY